VTRVREMEYGGRKDQRIWDGKSQPLFAVTIIIIIFTVLPPNSPSPLQ
jgi:hypothetical protein